MLLGVIVSGVKMAQNWLSSRLASDNYTWSLLRTGIKRIITIIRKWGATGARREASAAQVGGNWCVHFCVLTSYPLHTFLIMCAICMMLYSW